MSWVPPENHPRCACWRRSYFRHGLLGVVSGSPAERAGLRSGDRIMTVNGAHPADLAQAANLPRSATPDPVSITVVRGDREINALSQRERRSVIFARIGKKFAKGGMIVPQDTTRAEVDRISALDISRQIGRVFLPTHYPANPGLFYPGFEMFLLRDPAQLMVAGIEDGPGARAGVHYGDVVISVNGISVTGKTPTELEALFSSPTSSIKEQSRYSNSPLPKPAKSRDRMAGSFLRAVT